MNSSVKLWMAHVATLVCLVATATAEPVPAAEAGRPSLPPEVHYKLDVSVAAEEAAVTGRGSVSFPNTSVQPVTALQWSWPAAGDEPRLMVQATGEPVPCQKTGRGFVATLPEPLAPGDAITLDIEFTGALSTKGWFPRLDWGDVPGFDGFEVKLAVPHGSVVATSGRLNAKTGCYENPGAPDFGIHVGTGLDALEKEAAGVLVRVLHTPKGERCARLCLDAATDVVRFYKKRLGFFPFPSVTILPGASRPMGGCPVAPAMVAIHGMEQFDEKPELHWRWITAHELAHQYWGEYVLTDPMPYYGNWGWLMIGLGIYLDRSFVQDAGLPLSKHEQILARYVDGVRSGLDTTMEGRTGPAAFDFNNVVVHGKGYAVISALASLIGKDTMDAICRECLDRFAGRRMPTQDFEDICAAQAGRPLDWFFDQWVRSNAVLAYEISSRECVASNAGYRSRVGVTCLGSLKMPVPVEVTFADGSRQIRRTDRTSSRCELTFDSRTPLETVRLDPAGELAMVGPPPRPIEKMAMSETKDIADIRCGVLHVTEDPNTGLASLLVSDPMAGKWMNLTSGKAGGSHARPWGPVGSPDGAAVLYYDREDIWLFEVRGRRIRRVPEARRPFAWAPDGRSFAAMAGHQLLMIDRQTLRATVLASWEEPEDPFSSVHWSPDGSHLACTYGGELSLVDVESGKLRRLRRTVSACWAPDGKRLGIVFDGRLAILSTSGDVLKGFGKATEAGDWSPDSKHIAYIDRPADSHTGDRRIRILCLADGTIRNVDIPGDQNCPVWSPDGKRLAFWHHTGLMVVGPDGKNPKLLGASLRGSYMPPSWLPRMTATPP